MLPIGICTDFTNLPDAHRLGFDFVEISLAELAALPEDDFQEFADYVDGNGIRVGACRDMLPRDLSIVGPSVNASSLHGYLQHAFNRARRLNANVIVLDAAKSRAVPQGVDFPFAWRQLGNFLRLTQGHASDCGITVVIEPIRKSDCNLLNLVSEATLIAGLLQLNNIAVAAHSGHMAMASEPVSALRKAAPLLRHVHLENALTRKLPKPYDGEDYARLLRTLTEVGYTGGVSLCGQTKDFSGEAGMALEYLRNLMAVPV